MSKPLSRFYHNSLHWIIPTKPDGSLYPTETCELPGKLPDVHTKFSFVVHKTKKCFSSVALDRGHEQVNAGVKGEGVAVELTENPAVLKPRPNDRNVPTQHIATLLGAAYCVRLATLLRHVATCWV